MTSTAGKKNAGKPVRPLSNDAVPVPVDPERSVEFEKRPILHVDMDAFYAAIEQRDHPELRGRPVVVGAPPDQRGVVSTASYEARRFGVHSAMPSRTAGRLCPQAVFLPVRMGRYQEVSRRVMAIFRSFTPLVEQVSVDEAFLDVRGAKRHWNSPLDIAVRIKHRIHTDLKLTASVGVAPNKFLAKLASDLNKPDGLTVVPTDSVEIRAFLAPLPVSRLWGVGPVTERRLAALGVHKIGQLQAYDSAVLIRRLGKSSAAHLQALANGEDHRPIVTMQEEKSISNETTFAEDCNDPERIRQTLLVLTEKVGRRLRAAGKRARVGQIKLRYADFRTLTRQRSMREPTNSDRRLLQCALELLGREQLTKPVRLIGFGVHGLENPQHETTAQPLLFDALVAGNPEEAEARLDQAVDRLRREFGPNILRRGTWPGPRTAGPGASTGKATPDS